MVAINFVLQQKFKSIFDDGYDVDSVVRNITLINPNIELEPGNTIFFFDEMQDCPVCATSLKAFKIDGRYDVVCSGSLMGINYQEIESNSVGYKEDYTMHSMDFEEFLWAKGYDSAFVELGDGCVGRVVSRLYDCRRNAGGGQFVCKEGQFQRHAQDATATSSRL